MVRPVKHSISTTTFWANWDQSNSYETNYPVTYNDKVVS